MPPQGHIPHSERIKVRVRSQRACAPCRKRKIKCDGNEPCAACVGYGYDCVYTQRPAPRAPSTAMAASPVKSNGSSNDTARPPESIFTIAPPAKVNQPFMGQESIVSDTSGNPQLLQSTKTRFTSAYSAVAWPKRLGQSLGIPNPPRLQAFGWNPGMRAEQNYVPPNTLCDIISLEEMRKFTEIYFQEVHPFFGLLHAEWFKERVSEFWVSRRHGTDFEACMCMVFALGSYFSGVTTSSPFEAQAVEQGRLLLDMSFAYPPAMVSLKHVAAWTLRAIYLRCTTRPHISWMASCTAVHVAESIGLHREITDIQVPRSVTPMEIELRRRTFWVTMAVHQYLASEYGRSRIVLDLIACQRITPQAPDDLTAETMAILQSVPDQTFFGQIAEVLDALTKTMALAAKSPFLALLRADACFCIYRMLCSTNSRLPAEYITPFLEVVRTALEGVAFLNSLGRVWWNLVSTPFHSVCVLISVGSPDSLAVIPQALETLKNVTATYNSHLSNEALRTAYGLVQGARDKKSKELESLDRGLNLIGDHLSPPDSSLIQPMNEYEWPAGELEFQDCLDLTNYFGVDPSL